MPWSQEYRKDTYARLGAYEASKVEADAVFQRLATDLNVPWSIVNPSTVIGDSETGESDQFQGLAQSVREIWEGKMNALPGNDRTFVPVVAADYLARFMAILPCIPETVGRSYWVLDADTPCLSELLTRIGRHLEVAVPRFRVPVGLINVLPRSITNADPETLSFLSEDRYPTAEADEIATSHGLKMPDTMTSILRWVDHLVAHRFGTAVQPICGFETIGGVRTFKTGGMGRLAILPGLPVNADSWSEVTEIISGACAFDLPGLGLSAGDSPADWPAWGSGLLDDEGSIHLVGHSLGAALALEAATQRPGAVSRLTLVAPFFLQPRGGWPTRIVPLTARYLRRLDGRSLSRRLIGSEDAEAQLQSSVDDLRRPQTSHRVAQLLSRCADQRWRSELIGKLAEYPGHIDLVVGARDPLAEEFRPLVESLANVSIVTLANAGHHPQLTHPGPLASAIMNIQR